MTLLKHYIRDVSCIFSKSAAAQVVLSTGWMYSLWSNLTIYLYAFLDPNVPTHLLQVSSANGMTILPID